LTFCVDDLRRLAQRFFRRAHVGRERFTVLRVGDRPAHLQRLLVVFREVVGHARESRVHVGAAEFFRRHFLTGRGFDEWRTAQENCSRALDDDGFVGHCGNIGAARRARAHDGGNLRDAFRGHQRLIQEDAPQVVAIREKCRVER
jgi:hypothetical protein